MNADLVKGVVEIWTLYTGHYVGFDPSPSAWCFDFREAETVVTGTGALWRGSSPEALLLAAICIDTGRTAIARVVLDADLDAEVDTSCFSADDAPSWLAMWRAGAMGWQEDAMLSLLQSTKGKQP